MEFIRLRNSMLMPAIIQGIPLICEASGVSHAAFDLALDMSFSNGLCAFDTSHDYGQSEQYFGEYIAKRNIQREDFFVVTKIGNGQQIMAGKNQAKIEQFVLEACDKMKVDYCDVVLLHWPFPNVYIKNWESLLKVLESGIVKSIGIANADIRHLETVRKAGLPLPQIVQTEIHPFRTSLKLREYCKLHDITLQSCTSLCSMLPFVKHNQVLNTVANNYNKSITQIILRWHVQNGLVPIFRSYNGDHIREIMEIFDFNIEKSDLDLISSLNMDYRYHPESINCPGY